MLQLQGFKDLPLNSLHKHNCTNRQCCTYASTQALTKRFVRVNVYMLQVGQSSRAGRGRRSVSYSPTSNLTIEASSGFSIDTHHKELDDQLILMVPMDHTKPKFKLLQLQPSLKQLVHFRCILESKNIIKKLLQKGLVSLDSNAIYNNSWK